MMTPDPLISPQRRLSSAEHTRLALIRAGLKCFGEKGYDATTTREIATLAKANIGSISYHFGGKSGLRLACAAHVVNLLAQTAGSALGLDDAEVDRLSADEAEALLTRMIETMASFVLESPEASLIVQFVQRELNQPTEALERIYDGIFLPVHARLCRIWEAATGQSAESDQSKLSVFTLIGQLVYFRIAAPAVQRRMGWRQNGRRESAAIATVVQDNLRAMLAIRRKEAGA